MRKLSFLGAAALLVAAALLAACSRDIQNSEAIRKSVVDYLKARQSQTGLNMDAMTVEVTSVSFQQNEARATVYFRPKSGGPEANGMQMTYSFDRKGNQWVVRPNAPGVNPHGGAMSQMPPGHPSTAVPEGQAPNALPPGHPPVGSKQ